MLYYSPKILNFFEQLRFLTCAQCPCPRRRTQSTRLLRGHLCLLFYSAASLVTALFILTSRVLSIGRCVRLASTSRVMDLRFCSRLFVSTCAEIEKLCQMVNAKGCWSECYTQQRVGVLSHCWKTVLKVWKVSPWCWMEMMTFQLLRASRDYNIYKWRMSAEMLSSKTFSDVKETSTRTSVRLRFVTSSINEGQWKLCDLILNSIKV